MNEDVHKQADFFFKSVKTFLKTVKPWKKKETVDADWPTDYAVGWNDCLKEIQKNADKWFKNMKEIQF